MPGNLDEEKGAGNESAEFEKAQGGAENGQAESPARGIGLCCLLARSFENLPRNAFGGVRDAVETHEVTLYFAQQRLAFRGQSQAASRATE